MACSLSPDSLFWRHGGRRLVIKEEAGPERLGQTVADLLYKHCSHPLYPPALQRWSRVGSALYLVSLEMIAYPRARREEAAQLQTLRIP